MKVAILIGVSEYEYEMSLPGCDKDLMAVQSVIETSKNYERILCFDKNVTSQRVKSELSAFFVELKGEDIEELFFYFTGHGVYYQGEFYHVLTDYQENRRRLTSLENSEIDNWIKSISPRLVVKIIDACQSGVSYIKGGAQEDINRYYKSTLTQFQKCYFLHSSMSNQSSYQDDDLSYFTRSFLCAIANSEKSEIRYKHIIDYISDDFEKHTRQTPYFVTQADFTEIFITFSPDVASAIRQYVLEPVVSQDEKEVQETIVGKVLSDIIREDANRYLSEKEMEVILLSVEKELRDLIVDPELATIYNKEVERSQINDLPKKTVIGGWLKDNLEYFAEPKFERVSYQEDVPLFDTFSMMSSRMQMKTVTKFRNEIKGYEVTATMPFKCLSIDFVPNFPNLAQYVWILAFIVSKKDLKIFYTYSNYQEKDWTRKELNQSVNWAEKDFLLKDSEEILKFIRYEFNVFANIVLLAAKKKFGASE